MVTIPLQVSEELAERLIPLQDHLPEILELGLQHWHTTEPEPLTPRQQVEKIWAETGLVVPRDPSVTHRHPSRTRRSPVQTSGKPASEIIIEQRRGL